LQRIEIDIEGVSPLLMNRLTAEELEGLRIKNRQTVKANPPKEAREQAKPRVYTRQDTGEPYIPTENFMSCLIAAGVFVKLDAKRQLTNAKSSLIPGLMTIDQTHLDLVNPLSGKTATWEVDIRQGRNPNGGEAVCLVRPRFDLWGFKVEAQLDTQQFDEQRFRDLVDMAGSRVGLGDFRPSRKGIYGRFKVVHWTRL
jgi:hypothetical protein